MLATVLTFAASFSLHVSLEVSHVAASPRCVGRAFPPSFLTNGLCSLSTRNDACLCGFRAIRGLRLPLLSSPGPRLHPTDVAIGRSEKPASGDSSKALNTAGSAAAAGGSGTTNTRLLRAVQVASADTRAAKLFQRVGGKTIRRKVALENFPTRRALAETETSSHRFIVLRAKHPTTGRISEKKMDRKNTDTVTTAPGSALIGTHSGSFHADEVLATVMLLSLPEYKDAKLLRSRDPAVLAKCNVVVDVGSEYSPAALRFDHHQRSFAATFYDEKTHETAGARGRAEGEKGDGATQGDQEREERGRTLPQTSGGENGFDNDKKRKNEQVTGGKNEDASAASMKKQRGPSPTRKPFIKLSSAGLIYKHFGKRLLAHRYGITDPETLDIVYQQLYRTFVEAIDAIDNGVSIVPGGGPVAYKDLTNLSSRIAQCNPPWNFELLRKTFPDNPRYHPEKEPLYPIEIEGGEAEGNIGFRRAMLLAAEGLDGAARGLIDVWLPARDIVATAVKERYTVHLSGQIIKLERWCPFEEHLFLLEKEMNVEPPLLFCLYPEVKDGEEVGWRIRAVGVEGHMLESRLPLSSRFRGLRGTELGSAVCAVVEESLEKQKIKPEDFVHCHATGFIAGATTLAFLSRNVHEPVLHLGNNLDYEKVIQT